MAASSPNHGTHADPMELARRVVADRGPSLVVAIPLGVGKPTRFINALYRLIKGDSNTHLTIVTALTLEAPRASSELERRLVEPLAERLFGDQPPLDYARAQSEGSLPDNVRVIEFYFRPGARLSSPRAQQDYISTNYSQVARDVAALGVNVVAQLVAPGSRGSLSLGSNPDVTGELLERLEARGQRPAVVGEDRGQRPAVVGEVNRHMPFMWGDAEVDRAIFDELLDDPSTDFPLFGLPNQPVSLVDYAIGLHASTLVRDGGTLQLGIGAVADAVVQALSLRQGHPNRYRTLLRDMDFARRGETTAWALGGTQPFEEGLYATTEMFVAGYLELYRQGVLSRQVTATGRPGETHRAVLHGAFFVGPSSFYEALRSLPEAERALFRMMRVSFTNRCQTEEQRTARQHARFLNSTMMMSLLGDAASDTLPDGRVIGGVGGQHDFVTMAHELPDGRSVLMMPSTRDHDGERRSNIRPSVSHATVPRHLRDLVVTEYGVADLRGRTDAETVDAMLSVTDARFLDELVESAKEAGKLPRSYRIPARYRDNRHELIEAQLEPHRAEGVLPELPFGSDLTREEIDLTAALRRVDKMSVAAKASLLKHAPRALSPPAVIIPHLERMGLARPSSARERGLSALVAAALLEAGLDRRTPPGQARSQATGGS